MYTTYLFEPCQEPRENERCRQDNSIFQMNLGEFWGPIIAVKLFIFNGKYTIGYKRFYLLIYGEG